MVSLILLGGNRIWVPAYSVHGVAFGVDPLLVDNVTVGPKAQKGIVAALTYLLPVSSWWAKFRTSSKHPHSVKYLMSEFWEESLLTLLVAPAAFPLDLPVIHNMATPTPTPTPLHWRSW